MLDINTPPLSQSLKTTIGELNRRLDILQANPQLRVHARHKEYYAHSSIHGGSILKEHALLICASVDEDSAEYKTEVLPLVKRIETFFARPEHVLDFADEVRMLRARRLIEQGKYNAADIVYSHIAYGPIFAKAFEQRNHYYLNAAKNHLHLLKKLTHPEHVKQQVLRALDALQYVRDYSHKNDVSLYRKAEAIIAHNYYEDAKMQVAKICHNILPQYLKDMSLAEILMVYKAISPYKQALGYNAANQGSKYFNNQIERLTLSQWYPLIKSLQKHLVVHLFENEKFHNPEAHILPEVHALLNEPTSTMEKFQHIFVKTHLDKTFASALAGNANAVQNLQQWAR